MISNKFDYIDDELEQLAESGLYRSLKNTQTKNQFIIINQKKALNLSSNDYLGMPPTPLPIKQMQSSSRLISGNDQSYQKFEKLLARHKSKQSSLIYPTGYMANLGAIGALIKKGDTILSDKLNHASIIESCKISNAKTVIYNHNDVSDLESKIKKYKGRKFVITEGIFSMDGDYSNIKEISQIAKKHDSILILDDAHGDFTVGKNGKGSASKFGMQHEIDIYISSLSKGLGSFGGYVAAENRVIDFLINKSKPFIYTSALPSIFVEHAMNRFSLNRETYQKKLEKNTRQLSKGLLQIGYDTKSNTHIIPIIIGPEKKTMEFAQYLLRNNVFVQPIRYPTVPKEEARVRISVTTWLSQNNITKSLEIFEKAFKKFGLG